MARREGGAGQRHHRHAHPQRLAGREAAGIGHGVERQVDAGIGGKQILVRAAGQHLDPLRCDPARAQIRLHTCFRVAFAGDGRKQQQAAARHGVEDLRPQIERRRVELRGIVEAAEGDMPRRQRRQRRHRRRVVGRRVAEIAVLQADEPFAVIRLGARRGLETVADEIVDRREPGGRGIAEPSRLHGGGPHRADAQPVLARVPAQLDQDVEPVGGDALRRRDIVEAGNVDPGPGLCFQPRGPAIFARVVAVADRVHRRAIVMRQHAREEERDRVLAEIAREIADAQRPSRARRRGRPRHRRQGACVPRVPLRRRHADGARRRRGVVEHGEQLVAVNAGIVRRRGERARIRRPRGRGLAQVDPQQAHLLEHPRRGAALRHRALARGQRLRHPPRGLMEGDDVEMRVGVRGCERQRLFESTQGRVAVAQMIAGEAEKDPRVGTLRLQRHHALQRAPRLLIDARRSAR